ncbi:hypothetical protein GCM10023330_01520 [Litoribaculum gwangyangense]|uniref:Uncharacterized protein n=2 Tax=Litoribaculum gwangyangense TaxID=1130722 RepID=A0ABP9BVD7_9FLAO
MSFSQEEDITTQFIQSGSLYKTMNDSSEPLAQFKEGEKCIVVAYLGKYTYKIKYKEWEGFVKDQFLVITERVMDLYFDHEEEQRQKAIQERAQRQKRIEEIAHAKEDSIKKVEDQKQLEILEAEKKRQEQITLKRKQDSIAKAVQEEKLRMAQETAKRKRDSIFKVEQQKKQEALEAERIQLELTNQQRRKDSIAKAVQEEKQRMAQEIAKRKRDSIFKVEQQKQREALEAERKQVELMNQQRRKDSIEKAVNTNNAIELSSEELKFRNTCHYLINEYDIFKKQQIIITDKYFVNESLNIELLRQGNISKIHFNYSENLGCASYVPSTRSSVSITLENNKEIVFYHSGSLDCDYFSLKAILSESKIDLLKNSPIKSIVLKGTKASVSILNIQYKEFFMDKLKCVE